MPIRPAKKARLSNGVSSTIAKSYPGIPNLRMGDQFRNESRLGQNIATPISGDPCAYAIRDVKSKVRLSIAAIAAPSRPHCKLWMNQNAINAWTGVFPMNKMVVMSV